MTPMLHDVFQRLGLTNINRYQCPCCRRWDTLTFDSLTCLVGCACGWGGDIISVVETALGVDGLSAIKLIRLVYGKAEA